MTRDIGYPPREAHSRDMPTGGARFTKRYTAEQKDALLRAVFIDGQSIAEATRMAARGELGLPAFTVERRYAYVLVNKGRDGFEERDETALDRAVERELKGAELDALAHIRACRRAFKRDGGNPDAMKRAAEALAKIKRARREANTNSATAKRSGRSNETNNGPEPQTNVNTPKPDDALTSLLARTQTTVQTSAKSGSISRERTDASASGE